MSKKPTNRYVYYPQTRGTHPYVYDRDTNRIIITDHGKHIINQLTKELNELHKENHAIALWRDRFYACLKQNEENGVWFQAVMDYEKKNAKK